MKKFILAIAAAFMAASMVSAQDMAQATELYNNGATAISMKNWTEALDYFQKALEMGKTSGADADELVTNCKNAIPGVALEIAKDLIKDKKYEEAETKLAEVEKIATEYENAEVAERAKELVPQMWMQKGVDALKLKDFATAQNPTPSTRPLAGPLFFWARLSAPRARPRRPSRLSSTPLGTERRLRPRSRCPTSM